AGQRRGLVHGELVAPGTDRGGDRSLTIAGDRVGQAGGFAAGIDALAPGRPGGGAAVRTAGGAAGGGRAERCSRGGGAGGRGRAARVAVAAGRSPWPVTG